jgi:exopolysaccharide biosynthesis protein
LTIPLKAGVVLEKNILHTPAGPVLVSMLRVDLSNPGVHLQVMQAYNKLISFDEMVSSMANRKGALAGINGDYFESNGTGRPIGMEVINGQMMQGPSMYAVFGVTSSRQLTINHETFFASVADGKASYPLSWMNHPGDLRERKLGLITPALGAPLSVSGTTLVMLQPMAGIPNTFTVLSLQRARRVLPALMGRNALVGRGSASTWLLTHVHRGDRVRVKMQVVPDNTLFQALAGGPILIRNGAVYHDSPFPVSAYQRNPLTTVGISRDGKHALCVVFDGRYAGPLRSRGVTAVQAAYFLLAHGAYQAMQFDGGGSSEMVARLPGHDRVSVVNYPSDGRERHVANGLFVS